MTGRILIADDLATNRIALKAKLSAASYDVRQATTRQELLNLVTQERPDLLIVDGGFSNDRAIDICLELHDNADTAAIPVMIIAAHFTPADRLAALNAGACEVLPKPTDDAVLLAMVRNILRVHSIQNELQLRQKTVLELGFQEDRQDFQRPALVLVVEGAQAWRSAWQKDLAAITPCNIHSQDHAQVLDAIARRKLAPDIILLPTGIRTQSDGLFLLAELRSRPETRHAAIVILDDGANHSAAVSALDMGANDIIRTQAPSGEIAFRLHRQLLRKRSADQLRDMLESGLRMAVTDPLTGLFNRRYALPHLKQIAQSSAENGTPYTVMVLDLDHFKKINDTHGHAAGDLVLKEVAKRLKSNIRSVDLIARIGGEEFLVVMPDTNLEMARIAAERLRKVIGGTPVQIGRDKTAKTITASIGVSVGGGDFRDILPAETTVERADQALLGAKTSGRNQVLFESALT